MRILVLSHYFPPEPGAPQARLGALVRAWSAAGEEVTVLTGLPNHPSGVVEEGYRGSLLIEEAFHGARVVRTWLYATPNEGVLRKTIGHMSWMISAVVLGLRRAGPADVVVVSSPTFFSIFSAWLISRIKRARFVIEVRDLWPAAIVGLGVLRNRRLIRALEWLELASYRAADAVVPVSRGFRDAIVARGISAEKVYLVPNGVDVERFVRLDDRDAMRSQLGARDGDLLVLYAGAHGISYALDGVLDVAARLRDEPAHFAFVGDGAAKAALATRARALRLDNVTMHPAVSPDQMPPIVGAADVGLVPLRDLPYFETVITSKMFEYLAAGVAVIGGLRGESAEILREAGAIVVEPEDSEALAHAIRALIRDPARRETMGEAGRAFVWRHFDRIALADTYRKLLRELVERR